MEQKMRFGLVLGQLAILKKKFGADSEQLWRVVFHDFRGKHNFKEKFKNIVVSALIQFFKKITMNFFIG